MRSTRKVTNIRFRFTSKYKVRSVPHLAYRLCPRQIDSFTKNILHLDLSNATVPNMPRNTSNRMYRDPSGQCYEYGEIYQISHGHLSWSPEWTMTTHLIQRSTCTVLNLGTASFGIKKRKFSSQESSALCSVSHEPLPALFPWYHSLALASCVLSFFVDL